MTNTVWPLFDDNPTSMQSGLNLENTGNVQPHVEMEKRQDAGSVRTKVTKVDPSQCAGDPPAGRAPCNNNPCVGKGKMPAVKKKETF